MTEQYKPGALMYEIMIAAVYSDAWAHLTGAECARLLEAIRPVVEKFEPYCAPYFEEQARIWAAWCEENL